MRSLIVLLALLAAGSALGQTPLSKLHPPVKSAFPRPGLFGVSSSTPVIIPDAPSPGLMRALDDLRSRFGGGLTVVPRTAYTGGSGIIFTEFFADTALDRVALLTMPAGEPLPRVEGAYVLDVSTSRVVIAARDPEGLHNAIATLMQMVAPDGGIGGAHINDHPDYPVRWVFNQQNLRGTNPLGVLRAILDTMAALKLNGMQQNDFKYSILGQQPARYFDSVRGFRAMAEARGIDVIPGVASIGYSDFSGTIRTSPRDFPPPRAMSSKPTPDGSFPIRACRFRTDRSRASMRTNASPDGASTTRRSGSTAALSTAARSARRARASTAATAASYARSRAGRTAPTC